ARLHTTGVPVDWQAFYKGEHVTRIDLPTYAFQRRRYWVQARLGGGDVTAAGLDTADHPLLGAAVEMPDSDGVAFTGRLSVETYPWLADHDIQGTVLMPGTGLVELALHAGHEVGCPVLEELTLQAPLVLPEQGGVQVQVVVGTPDESGRRSLRVYSRDGADQPWLLNADGMLGFEPVAAPADLSAWPPAHAEPVALADAYATLLEQGFAYGPVFQGLRSAWRRGEELFAEVALPEEVHADAERFGIHPALLDSALHVALLAEPDGEPALPFVWSGVTLHAAGATELRVRLARGGERRTELTAADATGRTVVTITSVVGRPLTDTPLQAAQGGAVEGLFGIEWSALAGPVPVPAGDPLVRWEDLAAEATVPEAVLFRCPAVDGDETAGTRELVHRALSVVQEWLDDERYQESTLVVVTSGAVAVAPAEDVDVRQAAVWGLIRAAHAEAPGRFCLVDVDDDPRSRALIAAAAAGDEPEVAIRDSGLFVPRLVRTPVSAELLPSLPSLEGTVLVTGGTGGLGGVVAR
ncbi:polyketide synthase dehydratase domain-containing protein, partial [Streptomyces sp. NPDC019531]|uniref:polyketide synthase dehydratase domain-containing protein n=1 Tax=Streptomyces sp. NPDC019531 TaxID=3365062 RepID=UPI0038504E4B